jgi:AAA family ATP:ADP antiporter
VFNLFVVSVFWALMVDVFNSEQSKRLFGFISAGATLGAIVGSSITASLAGHVPPTYLMLGSAVLLEIAVFSVRRLSRLSDVLHRRPAAADEAPIGGTALSGLTHAFKSPYLVNVSIYILLYAITSTFLYFQQAEIARQAFANRGARTAFFARIDLWVNILTLAAQIFVTGKVLRSFGVAFTLATLPVLSVAGFTALAVTPTLVILVIYQVLRRAGNFAFARPSREVLFTVVPREDKYKAKSFIDTVVYRTGDQVGAWSYAGLSFVGLGIVGIAIAAVPISLAWLVNGLWLGRKQENLAKAEVKESARPAA